MEVNALKQFLANSSLKFSKEYVSSMLKTTGSKNILIEEWNTLIYQLKEVVNKLTSVYDGFDTVSKDLDNVASEITRVDNARSTFEESATSTFQNIGVSLNNIYTSLNIKADLISGKVPQEQLPIATTTSKGIASYDSNAFVLIDGKVYASEQYFDTYKEVRTVDNVTALPALGRADVLYLIGTELYCWNGTKYAPVKTIQSVEVAGVSKGSADNSLVFFDGTAYGTYSLVGGTDNAEDLGSIGDLTGIPGNLELPSTEKPLSISYGVGTKTKSTGSNAIGVNNIAGITGYYWHSIDFANKKITLSTERPASILNTAKWGVTNFDWAKDDYVSIVNDSKYPFKMKITDVEDNVITVDNLPFTESKYPLYIHLAPDDRTIFAVKRVINSYNHADLFVRSGTVELAWGATALGALNIAAGSFSIITGLCNITAGDFGAVFGRDNVGGYASIVGGTRNLVTGSNAVVGGIGNTVSSDNSMVSGGNHTISTGNVIVGGWHNTVGPVASGCIVGGAENIIRESISGNDAAFNGVFGYGHLVENSYNLVGGQEHTVLGSHNLIGGKNTITGISSYNIIGGDTNEVSASYILIAGKKNKVFTNNSAIVGYNNILNKTCSGSFVAGSNHDIPVGNPNQTVLGLSSDFEAAKLLDGSAPRLIVGNGNYNASIRSNAFVVTDAGNAYAGGKKLLSEAGVSLNRTVLWEGSVTVNYDKQWVPAEVSVPNLTAYDYIIFNIEISYGQPANGGIAWEEFDRVYLSYIVPSNFQTYVTYAHCPAKVDAYNADSIKLYTIILEYRSSNLYFHCGKISTGSNYSYDFKVSPETHIYLTKIIGVKAGAL